MQVVYLLVEVRKLMDRTAYANPLLRMFCNWVVHTTLEKPGVGAALILADFDALMVEIFERQQMPAQSRNITFGTFREALIQLFKHFALHDNLTQDAKQWERFCKLYSSVVGECPIVFNASKAPLRYVKSVELRGVGPGPMVRGWPVLQWKITLQNGDTMNWGFPLM